MKQEKWWEADVRRLFHGVWGASPWNEGRMTDTAIDVLQGIIAEATRRGIQQGKREAFADAERIARETMDSLELKTNAEYNACDDLTKRIVNKIWDKLSSLSNSSKGKV